MKKKHFTFTLSEESRRKILELAEDEDLNMSAYLRRLINQAYKEKQTRGPLCQA